MAKNVTEDVRRREADRDVRPGVAQAPTAGRLGRGFKKTYSREEWERIEAERKAMRERLLANG